MYRFNGSGRLERQFAPHPAADLGEYRFTQLVVGEAPLVAIALEDRGIAADDEQRIEVHLGRSGAQHLNIDVATDDRRHLDRAPRPRRQTIEAATDVILHAARKHVRRKHLGSDTVQTARRLRELAHGLDQKEGTPFGLAFEKGDDGGMAAQFPAQHGNRDVANLGMGEAPDVQLPHAGTLTRQLLALVVAERGDDQQRQRVGHLRQLLYEPEALADRMAVFELEQDWRRVSLKEADDDVAQARLKSLGVHDVVGNRPPQNAFDLGEDDLEDTCLLVAHTDDQRQLEHAVACDPIGGLNRLRTSRQGQDSAHQRARAHFIEQSRLAHPALSADKPGASLPRDRRFERTRQECQLRPTSDQGSGLEIALPSRQGSRPARRVRQRARSRR